MFLLPFHVVGVSHEANAADVVGRLRLSAERIQRALAALHQRHVPAVILSTCHRTELYWWGEAELAEWFTHTVLEACDQELPARPGFVQADADLAVRHLFSVAAGMRSVRFGEPEILGQVRRAWTLARDVGTSRGDIDAAFRYAIEAARHVRAAMGQEADATLGERVREQLLAALGTRADAAADAPADAPADAGRIVVVGSGDAARGVLAALCSTPMAAARLQVTSRTDARAALLANDFGVPVLPWDERERALREADAVVFAVHVTTPLVTAAFAPMLAERTHPALWVDLGVPGAVDTAFTSPHVRLVSLATIEGAEHTRIHHAPWRAVHDARQRRAAAALQHELARYARATHRHQLGARLGALEEQAVAVASSFRDAPVDEMVRKVTRLVLREFSRT